MAVIHRATLVPSKLELISSWLAGRPWGSGEGEVRRVGSYRFDDPAGEVGIEGFLVSRGRTVFHVLLTYRGAPLVGGAPWLVGTMEHSVLGTRWVYDGVGDPVAVAALVRAARGEQDQAALEVHDGNAVTRLEPDVRVYPLDDGSASVNPADAPGASPELIVDGPVAEVAFGDARLRVARVLGAELGGSRRLAAEWPDGEATVVAVV
ncbi:MAG: hypothetical protein HOQ07_04765 [Sinomonas sp.]|nr:hypothetical protein [Sinomonas sp.]